MIDGGITSLLDTSISPYGIFLDQNALAEKATLISFSRLVYLYYDALSLMTHERKLVLRPDPPMV